MAQILVRELDDKTVAGLKKRAKRRHRSLEGEVRAILEEAVEKDCRQEDAIAKIAALRIELAGRPATDSAELLHEGRVEWERKWESS